MQNHGGCRSELNPDNSEYVVRCIDTAVDLCLNRRFDALATGPVNKAVINRAGIAFSGHTEWIAARCGAPSPVMMLVGGDLRVCLLTTHIPLIEVPRRVTKSRLTEVIEVILNDLRRLFNIAPADPRRLRAQPPRRRRRLHWPGGNRGNHARPG